jgi:hypothetical protein
VRGPASLLLVAILAACSTATPSAEPLPSGSEAEVRPQAMVVDPARARPGQIVAVSFPGGWDRGILFALDAQAGGGWERRWMLISDGSGGEPLWFSSDNEVAVEAIGVAGEGPDHLLIPDVAEPGAYRVCTANAAEDVCAPIEIVAADGG